MTNAKKHSKKKFVGGKPKEIVERKGDPYMLFLEKQRLKERYITEVTNANYWLARANMLSQQIVRYDEEGSFYEFEKIDGVRKSKEFLVAEYFFYKLRARNAKAQSYFAQKEFVKFGFDVTELQKAVKELEELPAFREKYDDEDDRVNRSRAKFENRRNGAQDSEREAPAA